MKIIEVTEDYIAFDNGKKITYNHTPDCCESNFADFEHIDDEARQYDYDENLIFEIAIDYGFKFGDERRMFFVPCYSVQNGYYSSSVDIIYDGEVVLVTDCDVTEC